ncbi:SGNH/GDSL hydrolase family protein [Desulfocurvus sp.]|uniref:SGNH/GDSL hydrolase family protein n=1 Tax=Desulfocurvus sp. TaxID=2871698 RepID=UPI0025C31DFC|nr:SGNH/GDSL hydrolase family protein [Desulfocurvus sp.]
MQSYDNRCHQHSQRKPPGVFRVLCLGDSLTFGQGVLPGEAYPAVLEEHLNRFRWDLPVEVVNFGHCGYSLHDSVSAFALRAEAMEPDAVVLTLCSNDAELHSTPDGAGYREYEDANWAPEGPVFPLFRSALAAFKAGLDARATPLVLCFWSIDGDRTRPVAEQVGSAAGALGIDFLDLSQDFTGPRAAKADPGARVSAADGHPSAAAHRVAAMRLARHLLTAGPLAGDTAAPIPEDEVARRCVAAARAMLAAGRRPENACVWLLDTLAAKRQSRARLRLDAAGLLPGAAWEDILCAARQELVCVLTRRHCEGFAAFVGPGTFSQMELCLRMIERLRKRCMLLEAAASGAPLQEAALKALTRDCDPAGGTIADPTVARRRLALLHARMAEALERLYAPPPEAGPWSILPGPACDAAAPLRACLEEFTLVTRGARELALRIATLLSRCASRKDPAFQRALGLLSAHLGGLALALEAVAKSCHLSRLEAMRPPLPAPPATRISLAATLPPGAAGLLRIVVHYLQPFHPPVGDYHALLADGREHTYRWEVPLLVNATLRIELLGAAPGVRLAELLGPVTINEGSPGARTIPPEQAESTAPDKVHIPLALVHPAHG